MFKALDIAVDKLEKQLQRHKKKINTFIKKRDGIGNYFSEVENGLPEEEKKVVKEKHIDLTVMTVDEAINLARQFIDNRICSVACFEGENPVYSDTVLLVDSSLVSNFSREKLTELIFEDSTWPFSARKRFRVRFWNKEYNLSI